MNPNDYRNSSTIPDRYKNKDSWPHTFAASNDMKHDERGKVITKMYCTHCHATFWQGRDQRPTGVCPARKDSSEMKRLLG